MLVALFEFVVFHPWKAVATVLVGVVMGLGAFYVYQLNEALGAVATVDFDPVAAREVLDSPRFVPEAPPPTTFDFYDEPIYDLDAELAAIDEQLESIPEAEPFNTAAFGEPIDDAIFESYLLVGTDASGKLADTIILALQPRSGAPIMVSLPRDLFVWNSCRGTFTRLNSGLGGCGGSVSGSELLAIMVEDYTGIPIDHFARINFGGFAQLVDAMGGITVCVDAPTRDLKSHLLIEEPGCQTADGETALAWVRSRKAEQLVGEEWVAIGGSDFNRQKKQQDVLFQLAGKASGFSSPASLVSKLSAVASSVRLDSSWSFGDAIATGWRYRGISKGSVARFSISVRNYRTSYGAAVLLPTKTFKEQLSAVYNFG